MSYYSLSYFLNISSVNRFIEKYKNVENSGFAINYINNKRIGYKIYSQIKNENELKEFNLPLYRKFCSYNNSFNQFKAVSISLRTRNENFDFYVFASYDNEKSVSIKYPGDRICNYSFYNKNHNKFLSILEQFKKAGKHSNFNKIDRIEYAINYNNCQQIVVRRYIDFLKNDSLSLKDYDYFKEKFNLLPCATSIDIDTNFNLLSVASYYYQNLDKLNLLSELN